MTLFLEFKLLTGKLKFGSLSVGDNTRIRYVG